MRSSLLILCVLGTAVALLREAQPSPVSRFISYVLDNRLTTDALSGPCADALNLILRGTKYSGKWQINGRPRPGYVNLYVVGWRRNGRRLTPPDQFLPYAGTLAYLGDESAIAIDSDYLADVLDRLGLSVTMDNPFERAHAEAAVRREFMLWVLGHEAGHLIHGDGAAHSGGRGSRQASSSRLQQERELNADRFFAEQLKRNPNEIDAIANLLYRVLNGEIVSKLQKSKVAGPMVEFFDNSPIEIYTDGTHPEFVFRAMRLFKLLQYPPDSRYATFAVWMARIEPRLKPIAPQLSRIRIESRPEGADVTLADGTKVYPVYSTPADIVVPSGVWRISLTRQAYKGREITISVAPHSIREIEASLEADTTATTQAALVSASSATRDFDANQHVQHGRNLKFAQMEDAAGWEIDRAQEARPEWPTPLLLAAEWSAERGDTAAAKVRFARALARRRSERGESAVPPSSRNSANMHELAQKAAALERAAAIKSDDYDLWSDAGNAYLQANDRARAARNYQRSLKEYAGNSDALAGLGEIALAKGDLSEAERYCRRASDSQSETWSRAWNCLGRVFESQKAWSNAQTAYENAIWSDPEYSENHRALAGVLAFEHNEAVAALQRWMADELQASAK